MIRLQHIYNFLLFHAIILPVLDVYGLYFFFYIIFGTNLLTGGPARIAVFCLFQCFEEKEYQTSPNGMKPSGAIFLEQTQSRRLGVDVKKQPRWPRGCKGVRCTLHPRGPLTDFFRLYISRYPENIQEHHKTLFPLPQPSVSVRSHLGAFSGAPPEGESITEGLHIISKASPMSCE